MTRRRLGALLVVGVLVAVPATAGAATRPPVTTVDPLALPRGAAPALPWYDPGSGTLHDGSRSMHLGVRRVVGLAVAGDGYLLTADGSGGQEVRRVSRTGAMRVVARNADVAGPVVARGGRTFAYSRTRDNTTTIVVARSSDGRVLHRRRVGDPGVSGLLELTARKAMFSTYRHTWWWTFGTTSLRAVGRGQAAAATLRGQRVAASPSGEEAGPWLVSHLKPGGHVWRIPRRWTPREFSPSGRLLISGRTRAFDPRGYDVYDNPLKVSGSARGVAVRDFSASFGYGQVGAPRWESDDAFLVLAGPPRDAQPTSIVTLVWVRCRVSGRCDAASPPFRFDSDKESQVAYPPAWVVADRN